MENKTTGTGAATARPTRHAPVINVSDVDELYGAVNNPANVNTVVQLAPGTYKLDARGPLTMQRGMDLIGATVLQDQDNDGYPDSATTESIIDGKALNDPKQAIVQAGDRNSIRQVTLVGAGVTQSLGAGISTNQVPANTEVDIVIEGCVIQQTGRRGIQLVRLQNAQKGGSAVVENNLVLSAKSGVQFNIANDATDVTWNGVVRRNHIAAHDNAGINIERAGSGTGGERNSYHIESTRNLLRRNGFAGSPPGAALVIGSKGLRADTVRVESTEDQFIGNQCAFGIGQIAADSSKTRARLTNPVLIDNGPGPDVAVNSDIGTPRSRNTEILIEVRGRVTPTLKLDRGDPALNNTIAVTLAT